MNEKTPKRPVETPAAWVRFADENLAVAQQGMVSEAQAFHTVCFLCQSASEKYLKGYLIAQGWPLEKTHDIVALVGKCMVYDPSFEPLLESSAVLNEYIAAGRYPGDLSFETIGQAEAEEAVAITRRIEGVVKEAMGREKADVRDRPEEGS